MFLEASECQNNSFMLPHLSRDTYCTKGMFYRTDKIITHKYNPMFYDQQPKVIKDRLSVLYNILEPRLYQSRVASSLS